MEQETKAMAQYPNTQGSLKAVVDAQLTRLESGKWTDDNWMDFSWNEEDSGKEQDAVLADPRFAKLPDAVRAIFYDGLES